MATNTFTRSGADPTVKADGKNSGITVDPGPYEAIVLGHVKGPRSGQLKVYIPEWGADKTNPTAQATVSYASPFFGTTFGATSGTANNDSPGAQLTSGQSYGMWMVPPDVGNKVLVTFAAGDKGRGYWFACVYDSLSHHMVPGIGRNVGGDFSTQKTLGPNPPDKVSDALDVTSNAPVVEAASGSASLATPDAIEGSSRFLHEYQMSVLINQGLDKDLVRGAISSSSLREAPSAVFGISTPGASLTGKSQGHDPTGDTTEEVIARKGGHQFVMDDGDVDGNDQLIRLRTTGGHQILMNDKEHVLYIGSASGAQWLEFSSTGAINVYARAGFNVRAEGPLNFHSDVAVAIHSGGTVAINGEKGVTVESMGSVSVAGVTGVTVKSDTTLSLSALGKATLSADGMVSVSGVAVTSIFGGVLKLNTGGPSPALPTLPPKLNTLPDVDYNGTTWEYAPGALQSICTTVPAHEPWIDPTSGKRPK
jgi:hypothetical protein